MLGRPVGAGSQRHEPLPTDPPGKRLVELKASSGAKSQ